MGIADGVSYGNIDAIDKIFISMNNGKSLIIALSDKNMNIWAVRFYQDTLFAQRMKYLPYYE